MSPGLSGSHRWIGLSAVLGMLSMVSCGSADDTVAEGADVDRPAAATMDTVRFADVAADVGLDFRHGAFRWEAGPDPAAMMGGGLCWIDFDRDGWLDLYVVNTWSNGEWGRWRGEVGELPASRMYRNDLGNFEDVTDEIGARVESRGNGCVAADLDADGWTDLYVTTERENVLLWNDGGERFVDDVSLDVPSGAAAFGWHGGAAVGDVDGNGWPDLFVAGYADLNRRIPTATKGFPEHLRTRTRPPVPERRAGRGRAGQLPRGRIRTSGWNLTAPTTASARSSPTSIATVTSTSTSPTTRRRTSSTRTA